MDNNSPSYQELEATLDLYKSIADNLAEGICIASVQTGNLLYANNSFCRLFDYPTTELQNLHYLQLHPHFFFQQAKDEFIASIQQNKVISNVPCLKKDNTLFYADLHCSRIWYQNQECNLATFVDVTQQYLAQQAILEYDNMLKQLTDNLPAMISHINKDLIFLFANQKYCDFYSIKINEIVGKKLEDVLGIKTFNNVFPHLQKVLHGKEVIFETEFPQIDSSIKFSVKLVPQWKENLVIGYYALIQDITEFKNIEHSLKESESKYKLITDYSFDWEIYRDNTGKLIYSNPAIERIVGYKRYDFINGKIGLKELIHPDDFEYVIGRYAHAMKGNLVEHAYFRLISKDKHIVYAHTSVQPVYIDNAFVGLRISIQDVTSVKIAEQKLNETLQFQQLLLDNISSGVTIIDSQTHIIENVNIAACKLFGASSEKIIGKNCHRFFCPKKEGECPISDENLTIEQSEKILLTYNGSQIPILKTVKKIVIDGKEKLLETFVEITELKKAQEQIEKYSKELQKLNADKDRFMSIIAHDLRSPFVSILGFSELALKFIEKGDFSKLNVHISHIQKSSQRAYELLNNLLDWARSQTGRIVYQPHKMSLKQLLVENIMYADSIAAKKEIEISLDLENDCEVVCDKNMIDNVLRNLISNAIKFTNHAGEIKVSAIKTDCQIEITVADNGVGIDERIFNKLFKIDTIVSTQGTEKEQGSGLGLLLCKEFVEKHGGKIWIESQVGKGSKFKFILPLAPQ